MTLPKMDKPICNILKIEINSQDLKTNDSLLNALKHLYSESESPINFNECYVNYSELCIICFWLHVRL